MSFISARLGALRRLAAPSRPSLTDGGGGGGGGRASSSPRRVGEDDDSADGFRRRRQRLNAAVKALFVAAPLAASGPARAGPVRASSSSANSPSSSEGGLDKIKSGLKGAGISVLLGYAAAALIKTVGKTVALLLLAAYALSAYLTKKNFLKLDWEGMLKKAGSKVAWLFDVDRDGTIGVKDLKAAVNKASGLVGKTKMSSGAAFIAGLAWGLGLIP